MIAEAAGLQAKQTSNALMSKLKTQVEVGYLANIRLTEFDRNSPIQFPLNISGRDFLDRYAGTTDIGNPSRSLSDYAVQAPNFTRSKETSAPAGCANFSNQSERQSLREVGELMFAAHRSYTACGLDARPRTFCDPGP